MKTIVLVSVFVLAVCGLATLFIFQGCEDTIKADVRSPDGKYTATVYERDCGATTDFSTIVSVREGFAKFKGDALGPVIVEGQHRIDVIWDGNTRLRLLCQDCRESEIFKQERSWQGVVISLER